MRLSHPVSARGEQRGEGLFPQRIPSRGQLIRLVWIKGQALPSINSQDFNSATGNSSRFSTQVATQEEELAAILYV